MILVFMGGGTRPPALPEAGGGIFFLGKAELSQRKKVPPDF